MAAVQKLMRQCFTNYSTVKVNFLFVVDTATPLIIQLAFTVTVCNPLLNCFNIRGLVPAYVAK